MPATTSTLTGMPVEIPSGEHRLAGTFTVPHGTAPRAAALLIPGSGPVDRDSNHPRMRLNLTGELASALEAAGIATLRYDKRGVGASTGEFLRAGLQDNMDDARAALAVLLARPEVDPGRVVVIGHSEGAVLAAAVAAGRTDLAGVALLSASATKGDALLRWQARQIAPGLPAPVRFLLRLLRTDLEAKVVRNHAKIRATTTEVARIDGTKLNARWTREFLDHDPARDLERLLVPVLALTGTKDLQVPHADLERIAALVPGEVETHAVADVNHILRATPGTASLATYKKDVRRPVDPRVVELLLRWVGERTAEARRG